MGVEILQGKLSLKEVGELKELLRMEKEKGMRYAVIPSKKNQIVKEDISYYSSFFDAWKHIRQRPVGEDNSILQSLTLLQDEVDRIIETRLDWLLK